MCLIINRGKLSSNNSITQRLINIISRINILVYITVYNKYTKKYLEAEFKSEVISTKDLTYRAMRNS